MKAGDKAIWKRWISQRGHNFPLSTQVEIVNWSPRRKTADVLVTRMGFYGSEPTIIQRRANKLDLHPIDTQHIASRECPA